MHFEADESEIVDFSPLSEVGDIAVMFLFQKKIDRILCWVIMLG